MRTRLTNQLAGVRRRTWRRRLRRRILLAWPGLYATRRIKFERSLTGDGELEALLTKLEATLSLPGDIIECGSFLCGTTACMALHLRKHNCDKRIYACDTFSGFDQREFACAVQAGNAAAGHDFADNDFAYVQRKLKRLGVSRQITLVRGRFQETLASIPGPFAFAFVDCDLHDSLLYAARQVWSHLSAGGCCIFDDYENESFRGATKAIQTFLEEQVQSIRAHGPLSQKMYFAEKEA